jgi:hypothetical protein
VQGSLRRDRVVSSIERQLTVLPAVNQPLPLVDQYDQLLRRGVLVTGPPCGVSERAVVAAIEHACRMLWLPTIRDLFTETLPCSGNSCPTYGFPPNW